MIPLRVLGIGLIGPGLNGWPTSLSLLRNGGQDYRSTETLIPIPTLLPANERRRSTPTIKLALAAAEQAVDDAAIDADELATVFASSLGDMKIADTLCRALASIDKPVSPTQFHNSVHNAPAGYWSIATCSHHASTSLAAADSSFPAAMLEAAVQTQSNGKPVLLVCYDHPAPFPLSASVPLKTAFASALVVQLESKKPTLTLAMGDGEPSKIDNPELERVRLGNPAARALPLLQALAEGEATRVYIPYLERQLILDLGAR